MGEVADGGSTIILDTMGEDEYEDDEIEDLVRVFVELGMPSSVAAQMDNTRALDGMQTASWTGSRRRGRVRGVVDVSPGDDRMSLILTEAE